MSDPSEAPDSTPRPGQGPALPRETGVVVIGAGIVGSCLVWHLADLGWSDIVLLDKGPLPNPGGSTGHASNFIFPVDHRKELAFFTIESQKQYEALGQNTTCGGIEVARTEERMEELRRRMTSAVCWGVEAELLTPAQIQAKVPFINAEVLVGGFYTPSVSVVDSLEASTLMRQRAQDAGALGVFPTTEVLDLEVVDGEVVAVVTDRGRIAADVVVIACGVWSPRMAEMAGASIPLTPAVHQMADVGPIDVLLETNNEIGYPIVRDMDTFCYERQSTDSMEVGSYGHRPIFHRPDDIPSNADAVLSPTEMPFTLDDFEPQFEGARELMGDLLGDAEIRYAINGLLSLTPDAMPLLGETEVRNLWSAAAVWVREGPAVAQLMAEWITYGYPRLCDPEGSDIARLYPHERTVEHIEARCAEHFNKTYGIVHPREQWASQRGTFRSPFYGRQVELGAVFYEARGWERPQYYEHNAALVEHYELAGRDVEWDDRWWSPIQEAEHLAMRQHVGMVDLSSFQIFDLTGPGAMDYVQYLAVNQCDVEVGSSVYTPFLTPGGGFHSDVTVLRQGHDHFTVVTGAFDGGRDAFWIDRHRPTDGSVTITDRSQQICTVGVWGPKAPALIASLTDADLSLAAFPFGTSQTVTMAGTDCRLLRLSYVGDSGWEIYLDRDAGPHVWDAIWEAGQGYGIVPVGQGVYSTSGRLEKGYRSMGAELDSDYTPVEAGLARPKVKAEDFIGKAAYLAARDEEPATMLCTLTVEDHTDAAGRQRFMTGGNEPIVTLDGHRILDRKGRVSRVTTAGAGPSVGRYLLMAYLPLAHAVEGADLQVMYMNEYFPVKVARVGSRPLFDPENERLLVDRVDGA